MAQLVEQLIRNQQVAGSSPAISSNRKSHLYEVGFSIGVDRWVRETASSCPKRRTYRYVATKGSGEQLAMPSFARRGSESRHQFQNKPAHMGGLYFGDNG